MLLLEKREVNLKIKYYILIIFKNLLILETLHFMIFYFSLKIYGKGLLYGLHWMKPIWTFD